ncbi:TolC family protein [Roseivirga sp. E12]|uniref:TolC family protein n=1 Tax=Roseivirga sp. E12 TaxID=2819237 RepID=UPI001ABC3074|nr:TolC family protein [Roseivirga sp. E12]MBO3700226.1 TolC family protein [Roseivirga sp. E12]
MKKVIFLSLAIFCLSQISLAQQKRVLTLEEVIELAKANSRSAQLAETRRNVDYWNFRVYKAGLQPQLLLRGTVPSYVDRAIPTTQNNGTVAFRTVNQNNSDLSLGLEQVLPWTNTTVSFETNISRFDNYLEGAEQTLYQGDPVGITITQPLFTVNPFKWDKQIEPLNYEQSKRAYVQDIELASQEAARRFFQLLIEQKNLEIAEQNRAANDTINKIQQGRYNIGTTTEDEVLNAELNLITAQSQAAQAAIDVQTRTLELRNFIGLTDDVELELVPPADAPEFQIDYDEALEYAKKNRAEFLDFQLQRLQAQRTVAEARARRFNASLSASFGYVSPQVNDLSGVYSGNNLAAGSTVRLNFNMPILDGGRNRARMNQALESQKRVEFNIEQNQVNFEQEIANSIRNFEQIRTQIEISLKRQEIAQRGFEVTNGRYLAGKVGILELNNARDTKDSAIRNYIDALRQYWNAYYELRTLTLYDFRERRLLYNPLLEYDPKSDSMVERIQNK